MARLDATATNGARLRIHERERGVIDLAGDVSYQNDHEPIGGLGIACILGPVRSRDKQKGLPVLRKASDYVTNQVRDLKFDIADRILGLLLFLNQ